MFKKLSVLITFGAIAFASQAANAPSIFAADNTISFKSGGAVGIKLKAESNGFGLSQANATILGLGNNLAENLGATQHSQQIKQSGVEETEASGLWLIGSALLMFVFRASRGRL